MASLMPQGKQRYTDNNGNNLAGGKLYTYESGTSTPLATYSDQAGATPNTNPVVLNARGEATIFWGSAAYKAVLKDASDVEIWTQDNIRAAADLGDLASTSSGKGAALIGYSTGVLTVKAALDERLPEIGTYALLRLYAGSYTAYYVRGVSNILDGGAGVFRVDSSDTTSADNGGTIIVDASNRRWKREISGAYNVKWFGAAGNGITNDTTAVQNTATAAAAAGAMTYAPAGNYLIGQITFPSTSKGLTGDGATATKFTITGTFSAFSPLMFFNQLDGFYVGKFAVHADTTTYATNHATQFGSCSNGVVEKIRFTAGGYISLYAPGCSRVTFRDCLIDSCAVSLFVADTSPSRLTLDNVVGVGFGTGVGVAIAGGSYHKIVNCYVPGAGTSYFSISLYQCSDSIVANNYVIGSTLEAIQITDGSRNRISDNTVFCLGGHNDFGISIFADGANISHNKVSGNTIIGSGGSGIGVSASYTPVARICQLNSVTDNLIINPNQRNDAEGSGVLLLGGATCTGNTVANNTCVDESNKMRYGANEWNSGGNPDNNRLIHNSCFGGAVFVSEGNVVGTNSQVFDLIANTYTPTITAGSGTITTASGTIRYQRHGRMAFVEANISVTTNGTGAGFVTITTPFGAVEGCLVGRANAVSGKGIQAAKTGASSLAIRNYDGTYPAADGENLLLSGTVRI